MRRLLFARICTRRSTLVGGDWELKRHTAPAQCVLLDYYDCKKHWHETGIETNLEIRGLKRILEIFGVR
jgi:hypothetical protein